MKKLILNTLIVALIAVGFTSCDDYLDVNTPSEAVNVKDAEIRALMAPIIHRTVYGYYNAEASFGNYTQYFGGYGYGALGKTQNLATWNNIYLRVLPNAKIIKEKAQVVGATKYVAVIEIIEAMNLGLAVDSWDNVPYSEATIPLETVYPKFDSGQEVYNGIMTSLDNAIATLQGIDDSGYNLSGDDLIYGGDYDKWIMTAYMVKARLQLRLLNKGLATTADVLESVENGYTSNSDDFDLEMPSNQINPWYSVNVLSAKTGNYYRAPNDQLISMLNGTTYPFESGVVKIDPRLPEIYVRLIEEDYDRPIDDDTTPWRGGMNGGDGISSDGEDLNTFYKDGGFLTAEDAPLTLITYAEAMFIKAEMLFLAAGGNETSVGSTGDAYAAYMEGIAASMAKIGVRSPDDYMADTAVDVGEGNLMLHHIMKEKYIANIHNTETYTDFRRYNYSPDVFKGLELRLEGEDTETEMFGKWYQRAIYPTTEKTANADVVSQNWQEPDVPVWWAN
ncbi:MAG: SusD/RagB family nutrient-binding outer membrane lipoprotein [Bacteroidota bacterium]